MCWVFQILVQSGWSGFLEEFRRRQQFHYFKPSWGTGDSNYTYNPTPLWLHFLVLGRLDQRGIKDPTSNCQRSWELPSLGHLLQPLRPRFNVYIKILAGVPALNTTDTLPHTTSSATQAPLQANRNSGGQKKWVRNRQNRGSTRKTAKLDADSTKLEKIETLNWCSWSHLDTHYKTRHEWSGICSSPVEWRPEYSQRSVVGWGSWHTSYSHAEGLMQQWIL